MVATMFRDRRDAGRVLAGLLDEYRGGDDVVVLALPRGGVPVAYEVAVRLGAPLDVFVVRKLGVPDFPELAMGAIASGGVIVTNDDVLRAEQIDPRDFQRVAEQEGRELRRREKAYREGRPVADVAGKTVILVDDGMATGATMRAVLEAVRQLDPARIVVAVPAAPASSCQELSHIVDHVVCATTPAPFYAVGAAYWEFGQTSDDEVKELLRKAAAAPAEAHNEDRASIARRTLVQAPHGMPPDDALFEWVGDARLVLLGEASHGTHEFYSARAEMTKRLIEDKGFQAVVFEADWPDAYRVNRYVLGRGDDGSAEQALRGFERFPTWMWRNTVVSDFVDWLREHNARIAAPPERTGFYGMDLYSLYRSAEDVIRYLDKVDADAARRARERYSCFEQHGTEGQEYGYSAAFGSSSPCEQEAVAQLADLQRHATEHAKRDGLVAEDEQFFAEQNARLVRSAEEYYRTMFGGRVSSWNLRDQHMVETIEALGDHLGRHRGVPAKMVVWAHNSHLGDARATEVASVGEWNVGQLLRERYPDKCRILGFTTHTGTVTAADDWGEPADCKRVRPALDGSVEKFFHDLRAGDFWTSFEDPELVQALRSAMLERAIGVVYRPRTERRSHYFRARIADQFDAVIHIDRTTALEPLERTSQWESGELPETYPYAV
ncbi:erythromycin esterase family protein [Nocardia amamiensis]|uniref:Erythromycin esterase family protein n=1 Tax=Nocardia amamiensis TaxID=404578 RepID=A0ABS0CZY7_9NOCA|nr:erythromycin esterase family protein [Nocardia amamiensis]MBF6302153.1 erythromycin esterase family protein [Nocardia amamiensis]